MGGPVRTDKTAAIQGENNVEILQADVVQNLVVSSLEKCRIDGHYRDQTFNYHHHRKNHNILLNNADVIKTIGNFPQQFINSDSASHRSEEHTSELQS